jgi:hypothetical protein
MNRDKRTNVYRSIGVVAAVLGFALPCAGCDEAPDAAVHKVLNAWTQAELVPTGFNDFKNESLGKDAQCKQGLVQGVETTLCQYPTVDAARAAYPAGLIYVGEITGLTLASGKLLLIVADRDSKDPTGRTINQIAQVFGKSAPTPPPPSAKKATTPKATTPATGKKNDSKAKPKPASGEK